MPNLSTLYVEFLASKKFHTFSVSRWVSRFYFIYTKFASSKLSYLKIAKISADEYFFVLGKSVLILPYKMKIYMELNLKTGLRLVKFVD